MRKSRLRILFAAVFFLACTGIVVTAFGSQSFRDGAQYQNHIGWKVIGPFAVAMLGLTVFVLIWNRRLERAVGERKRIEHELRLQARELQAQQVALQETEAWFRSIIESAPDGMVVADESGLIILANAMVDKMFGYKPGELIGVNIDALVPPAKRDEHKSLRESFLHSGSVREMGRGLDLWGARRDGSQFPVEIGLSKLPASGSHGLCVCASIRDITERNAAERALVESRERLQYVLDASPIAAAISQRGVIRFANRHFTKLFGPNVGDAALRTSVNPADQERLVALLRKQEVVPDYEIQVYGADGKIHDLVGTYIRTEFKGDRAILGWLVDITNIKAAEKALTESEQRSRLILESAGEGIFGVDTSGCLTFANRAALRLLGYREEELIGQKIHRLIHHSRADGSPYPFEECPVMASYERGRAYNITDEVLWRKDGGSFYAKYSSTPMQKDGRVVGSVVTFRDVSERKKAEEEIRKYVQELERFNQLVTGRETRMIQLKGEINDLRAELGRSPKYLAAAEALQDREFKLFGDTREESVFSLSMVGNIGEGRPNLGSAIDVGVYRLMQFSIRDVLLRKFDPETAARVFFEAGELMGMELYRSMIAKRENFNEFIKEIRDLLSNLKICTLEVEKADMDEMSFTITLSEDLECSGMPVSNETICAYDEGFLSGLLTEQTGARFSVKEVNCWCSGDRLCRFEVKTAP